MRRRGPLGSCFETPGRVVDEFVVPSSFDKKLKVVGALDLVFVSPPPTPKRDVKSLQEKLGALVLSLPV
jgi:hypothetical protein